RPSRRRLCAATGRRSGPRYGQAWHRPSAAPRPTATWSSAGADTLRAAPWSGGGCRPDSRRRRAACRGRSSETPPLEIIVLIPDGAARDLDVRLEGAGRAGAVLRDDDLQLVAEADGLGLVLF